MSDKAPIIDTEIHLDGIPMRVTAVLWHALTDFTVYHFEYWSLAEPRRAIPISKTGYKSQFHLVEGELSIEELTDCAAQFCALHRRQQQDSLPGLFD